MSKGIAMHNSSLSGLLLGVQNRQQDCGVSWCSHKMIEKPIQRAAAPEIRLFEGTEALSPRNRRIYDCLTEAHKRMLVEMAKVSYELFWDRT
jgi:hypothetical protein